MERCPLCASLVAGAEPGASKECRLCGTCFQDAASAKVRIDDWIVGLGTGSVKVSRCDQLLSRLGLAQIEHASEADITRLGIEILCLRAGVYRVPRISSSRLSGRPLFAKTSIVRSTSVEPCDTAQQVTLGVMTRPTEAVSVAGILNASGCRFARTAVLVDSDDQNVAVRCKTEITEALTDTQMPLEVYASPLNRDFGAQRNRLQEYCRTDWMFHLDTDETVDDALMDGLAANLAYWSREKVQAVCVRRLNLVDGAATMHWPDYLPRLIRRGTKIVNKVHEEPAVSHWSRQHYLPLGHIEHHLESTRLPGRDALYSDIDSKTSEGLEPRLLREPLDIPLKDID